MSFPLGSIGGDTTFVAAARVQQPPGRWRRKAWLLAAALGWLLFTLALVTHHPADPGFSTSGTGEALRNKAGLLGARVADLAYFLFGFSAWWLVPIGLRAWLIALARLWRSRAVPEEEPDPAAVLRATPAWGIWVGIALLLAASTALEWTRLYRWETLLPGHAGGVLGYLLGTASARWLGFAGSGVLWIALLVAGTALAFQFSWARVADAIGERIDGLRERRQGKIEREQDRRIGEAALRDREHVVEVQRQEGHDQTPLVIAAAAPEIQPSQRVVKERQKPLFAELVDTKLPQVDLLDNAAGRQESVTPESLEMTSRLIEKKLRDFGVEVRVVAASPGPVITRYEIEPATGVKGAQVVNLAKDLARSLSLVSIRVVEIIPG
ncbi:MAG: DNA translocase FtsK 4TM domain-containing protein, partial [Chitinophagaceae bacterium]|nr:DNA translocase FtsK 4TM domain-containing protein [Rubrivivax sp.]